MKKKILIGSIIAVALLTLVSFSSVVGYSSVKSDLDISVEENVISKEFELQRIKELTRSIDLWRIIVNPDAVLETLEEISTILEEEDVRNYIEKTSDEDCGCEDDSSGLEWYFPMICTVLYPTWMISIILLMLFSIYQPFLFLQELGREVGCFWMRPWYPFVYSS